MDDVERLLKGTTEELSKLLEAQQVLGEPIERNGITVIPMVSFGFGFGAGGGTSAKSENGGGTGAGGGIKPIGAIIFDENGARVESVKSGMSNLAEVVGETALRLMEKKASEKSKDMSDGSGTTTGTGGGTGGGDA